MKTARKDADISGSMVEEGHAEAKAVEEISTYRHFHNALDGLRGEIRMMGQRYPHYRSFAGVQGKAWAAQYIADLYGDVPPAQAAPRPVLYVGVPTAELMTRGGLAQEFLRALGNTTFEKRWNHSRARDLLVEYLVEGQTELVILGEFHNLLALRSRVRADVAKWVTYFFKNSIHNVQLLMLGEKEASDQIRLEASPLGIYTFPLHASEGLFVQALLEPKRYVPTGRGYGSGLEHPGYVGPPGGGRDVWIDMDEE